MNRLWAQREAFDILKVHVQHTIVDEEGAERLTSLLARYANDLREDETVRSARFLCEKLLKYFQGN